VLPVAGRAGIPADAGAVVLNVTAVDPTAASWLTVFPTGSTPPGTSSVSFPAGLTVPNLVVAKIGPDGSVSIANARGSVHVLADVTGWLPAGADLQAVTPARLLDTRSQGGAVGAGGSRAVSVLGRGGVPASGVGTVVLNVTATNPTAVSWITVHPTGEARPTASNLNVVPGQTVANLVLAKVATDGTVTLTNARGATDLVVDVVGWARTDGAARPLSPARLVDTRAGQPTVDGRTAGVGRVGAGGTLTIPVAGRGGVPATGAVAVVLNVTATAPSSSSWLTVHPSGSARPTASNLNVVAGQTVPNLVVATLGPDGAVKIYNHNGSVDLVVDVLGWIAGG
jgi:hypothetical protein